MCHSIHTNWETTNCVYWGSSQFKQYMQIPLMRLKNWDSGSPEWKVYLHGKSTLPSFHETVTSQIVLPMCTAGGLPVCVNETKCLQNTRLATISSLSSLWYLLYMCDELHWLGGSANRPGPHHPDQKVHTCKWPLFPSLWDLSQLSSGTIGNINIWVI